MPTPYSWIAFDGDDTLWENEIYYSDAKRQFRQLMADYGQPEWIAAHLDEIEVNNIQWYGYGIKSYTLSMIQTAIAISNGQVPASVIDALLAISRQMLEIRVAVMPGVAETLARLAQSYPLLLITKGDTFEQARKIQRTGLAPYFTQVEIVADKYPAIYQEIYKKYNIAASQFLMVGNSLRSDILPVLKLGGHAIYVPYHSTWSHEHASAEELAGHQITELSALTELPAWLDR